MTDRADLIRRLEEAAEDLDKTVSQFRKAGSPLAEMASMDLSEQVALLREAVKALEGGTTNDPDERYCYVNCGLPAEQCACYRRATKAP